jgi:hypothetical protein
MATRRRNDVPRVRDLSFFVDEELGDLGARRSMSDSSIAQHVKLRQKWWGGK